MNPCLKKMADENPQLRRKSYDKILYKYLIWLKSKKLNQVDRHDKCTRDYHQWGFPHCNKSNNKTI